MAGIELRRAESREELARCLNVRRAVFTLERGVPPAVERDGDDRPDGPCEHFLITVDGADAGALRTRREGDAVRLQRFCVAKEHRGRGAARAALEALEERCRGEGARRIALDAKLESAGFYAKCGYQTLSLPFEEAGVPHVRMGKRLEQLGH